MQLLQTLLQAYYDRAFGEICYGVTKMELFTEMVAN